MKKAILFFFLLLSSAILLAQADTTAYQGKAGIADVADEDPGLFIFMMIFLLGLIVSIFVCLIGAAILALFAFLLVAAGIVSVSVFVGLYKRSVFTGLKWFIYLSFGIAGALGVSLLCFLLYQFGDTSYSLNTLLSWGIPAGLAGGLLGGWILLTISKAVYRHFFANKELEVNV